MSIQENLKRIQKEIPDSVKLIAVSKTKPIEDLKEAYEIGQIDFGENKAQELQNKSPQMPDDVNWHMIGHMQRNKVKYIAPFVHLIHAVDSWKLAKEIDKQAEKNNRVINCLIQFHIADEETKFGFDLNEFLESHTANNYHSLVNVKFIGVMGMATYTDDENKIKSEFKKLKSIFETLKSDYQFQNFSEISMGMSQDYHLAIEEGSTMVRIGSSIFGARNY
ncbi:MAG: YggS family pyridoxal phosphate-dependent enzyme [Salinivirgaceae bacterium]|nr:MAG: YggS family pyridoxal phosphate-dependent enzyme [Salinivirgaceae bacterium]